MARSIENPVSHRQHAILLGKPPCEQNAHNQYSCPCGWRRIVQPHSVEEGWTLVRDLFDRIEGPAVTYKIKDGCRETAILNWWRRGICTECGHRSITGGVCIHCGKDYKEVVPPKVAIIRRTAEGRWYHSGNYHHSDSAYRAALSAFDGGADEIVVPDYQDITDRVSAVAEKDLLGQADVSLIAKANPFDNFLVWAHRIVADAIVGAVILNSDREIDWFNIFCAYPKTYRDGQFDSDRHALVKRIARKVWEDLRK